MNRPVAVGIVGYGKVAGISHREWISAAMQTITFHVCCVLKAMRLICKNGLSYPGGLRELENILTSCTARTAGCASVLQNNGAVALQGWNRNFCLIP